MNTAAILPHPDSMLAEALRVAREGFPLVPVYPDSKRPANGAGGFNNATTDAAQITEWWSRNPAYMIGVKTGKASGFVVLDLDLVTDPATGEVVLDGSAKLQEVMDRNGWTLPDTVEVKTPRGGLHLYFQYEPEFTKSNAHEKVGIDYRCDGAMIVYPPSRRSDGKAYRFTNPPGLFEIAKAPAWLAEFFRTDTLPGLIERKQPKQATGPTLRALGSGREHSRPEDVERALFGYWDPDSHKDWSTAALALHAMPGGKEIWLRWAAQSPKFNAAENEWKWSKTVPDRGITTKSILDRVPRTILSEWGREHAARNPPPDPLDNMVKKAKESSSKSDNAGASKDKTKDTSKDKTEDTSSGAGETGKKAEDGKGASAAAEDGLILRNGKPVANVANVLTVLRSIPEWRGVVAFDRMAAKVMLQSSVPDVSGRKPNDFRARPITEADIVKAVEWLQHKGLVSISKETVGDALALVAEENAFDPLEDKLRSLTWDGVPRIETWLTRYCGAAPTETQPEAYIRAVGRRFLISAAARALWPGCKVDSALVLVGPQGIGKSKAGRILAYDWFSDSLPPVHTKDAADHLRGVWLVEFGEMATASKADVEEMKAFITRTTERFRPAYGRLEIEYPRRNVFFGTTNRDAFLKDETGNRRFWPVVVSQIDAAALTADRDQLWAEAVRAFDQGEAWHLTEEESRLAAVQQAAFVVTDERGEILARKLRGRTGVTTLDCLALLEMKTEKREQMEVAGMLRGLGWQRRKTREAVFWVPPVDTSPGERCPQEGERCPHPEGANHAFG